MCVQSCAWCVIFGSSASKAIEISRLSIPTSHMAKTRAKITSKLKVAASRHLQNPRKKLSLTQLRKQLQRAVDGVQCARTMVTKLEKQIVGQNASVTPCTSRFIKSSATKASKVRMHRLRLWHGAVRIARRELNIPKGRMTPQKGTALHALARKIFGCDIKRR